MAKAFMYSKQRQMQYRHLQKCFVQSIPRDLVSHVRRQAGLPADRKKLYAIIPFAFPALPSGILKETEKKFSSFETR